MDYKEKYEMALEGIQEILGSGEDSIKMSRLQLRLQGIFPELKESEDERIRKSLIVLLQHFCKGYRVPGLDFPVSYKDMLAWLEKQGEQKPADWIQELECKLSKATSEQLAEWKEKYFKVETAEWSEEDEKMYKKIETAIDSYYAPFSRDAEEMSEWFKNLKDRVQPQSQWKPSDRQMNVLEYYMYNLVCNEHKEILSGLYADLKKLKR